MQDQVDVLPIDIAIWVPFVSAILGGVLSLVGALWATNLNSRIAKAEKLEMEKRAGAVAAYEVMFKMLNAYNSVSSLKEHIDGMFEEADKEENSDLEPWAKVKVLVTAEDEVKSISPADTMFLLSSKNAGLINEVHLVQSRMANILASSRTYNDLRNDFQLFFESQSTTAKAGDGTNAIAEFQGNDSAIAQLRVGQLNNLLGQIMHFLEADIPRAWQALNDFKTAAKKEYGDDFPEVKLELAQK